MNSQFLEFFGNYMIQTANWQKLIEQTSPGVMPNVMNMAEFGTLFKQACSLNGPTQPASAELMWRQAIENFQSVFCLYANLWGWVPQADYQALQEKCKSLEKTIQKQDQTISQLRSLLDEKGLGQIELLQRFQSLIQDQSDEFQTFVQNFGELFVKAES